MFHIKEGHHFFYRPLRATECQDAQLVRNLSGTCPELVRHLSKHVSSTFQHNSEKITDFADFIANFRIIFQPLSNSHKTSAIFFDGNGGVATKLRYVAKEDKERQRSDV